MTFKMARKGIKGLGINLTKEVKDLYAENDKILIRKLKVIHNGKISHTLD